MTAYDDFGMPVGAYTETESLTHQAYRVARAFVVYRVKPVTERVLGGRRGERWNWKAIFSLGRLLIVLWVVVVYWSERSAFRETIDSCEWENWEKWEEGANPHRLLFVSDPQLIDPHSYPGRPWPLDSLTYLYTDQYMRRTFSRMQEVFYPDTIIFLGDLFDGGREWSTRLSQSPEEQYRKYGNDFWLREYDRFGRIYYDHWGDAGMDPRAGQPPRKMITTLPGNHDLGFGRGVQIPVRKRFNAYFGFGNRVDVIANHTFVSIDGLSLSALAGEGNPETSKELWEPTMEFLDGVKAQKQRLVSQELRKQQGLSANLRYSHDVVESQDLTKARLPKFEKITNEFPTVLLTHVPLYREEGTPCGPQRERWPPTPPPKGQEPLEKDDRNAIAVRGGYQYQNVLHREITVDVAEKVGDIEYAFSGDDHDYCEVIHRNYASAGRGIKEITVKSTSWAMGVRHPGVVLVSLWNPVDKDGAPLNPKQKTLQTHLCIFPDQLGIFIRYALLFFLTLFLLAIRAALVASGRISTESDTSEPTLLPTTEHISGAESEKSALQYPVEPSHDATLSNSSTSSARSNLQVRSYNSRTRSVSPGLGYALPSAAPASKYTFPLVQHAGYYGPPDEEVEKKKGEVKVYGDLSTRRRRQKRKGLALFNWEFSISLFKVGVVVLAWYFWLVWRW
ncbi:Metallo-dependent phosphatase-like protein [Dendryphion nanum]|uniref:Metallo-dependent phosphatase-like protein n=1 Tax=Dendryphion nanum TaxID=256645 RepID=A0A9P9DRS6_9PLEO|nr:Metallo-dependent phosphatase-like protein [Dendryphion nanum]